LGPLETVRDGADTELSQLLLCPSGAAPLLGQSLRAARQGVPFPPELEGYLAYLHGEDSLVLQMQKKALAQRTPELCSQNAQALFAQRRNREHFTVRNASGMSVPPFCAVRLIAQGAGSF